MDKTMKAVPNKLNHRGTSAVPVFGRVVLAVLESFTFSLDSAGLEGVKGCVSFDRLAFIIVQIHIVYILSNRISRGFFIPIQLENFPLCLFPFLI